MSTARVLDIPDLPPRPSDGHKGTFGKTLIVAGSQGMSGAASLCGMGALRAGAGLVFLAVPVSILQIVASYDPSYLTIPLSEDETGQISVENMDLILDRATSMDVVAIGPGLGQSHNAKGILDALLQTEKPLVLDADALNLLQNGSCLAKRKELSVLTPHPGEFSRMTGRTIEEIQQNRETLAVEFALSHEVVLLLKGRGTIVTDGYRVAINQTGNPGMATGGAGDVLTGVIAGLMAQGMPGFEAAQLGAHLHGLAGDVARDTLGEHSIIASDLLDFLPEAFQRRSERHL